MNAEQLNDALDAISRRVRPGFTEDAVEHTLTETRFYEALGYERTGRDIRRKPKGKSGIPDALLLNSDESIQVVVEVKRPGEDLTDHVDQLARYVRDLRARFGLLTNGSGFRLYRRDGQALTEMTAGTAAQVRAPDLAPLAKGTLDRFDRAQVEAKVRESQGEGLPLRHADDLPSTQFLYSLGLQQGSPFATLVQATARLLADLGGRSEFVGGSYDFWKKVYARELDADHIPRQWRDSGALGDTSAEGLYRFSFALETSYALAARLMLAKVIQDHSRGGAITGGRSLADELITQLGQHVHPRTGALLPEAYPEAVRELFDRYARSLFTSVYATDLFDWWRDYARAETAVRDAFSDALARLLLALLRFDFSTLEGDLLGELYQQYFDPETRKALGEFYTPPAVVNFILDEVGYTGGRRERLLDPATGSGTFLIGALRRYLSANVDRDPVDTLRGLTEEYALVAFDLNPFAVIMAQVNFAALLVPLYARAAEADKDFVLRRLPIIRTDSLRQEDVEGEALTQGSRKGQSMFGLDFGSTTLTAQIELPIRTGGKVGHIVHLTFPQVEEAKRQGVVDNEREWLRALQAVFAAVELRSQAFDRGRDLPDPGPNIRSFLARGQADGGRLGRQVAYLTPYAEQVWDTLRDLKERHGDGRFLKTLEDLMLGLVLKHYLKYDYVVGNPPYVRIQNLPENLRRSWETMYVWAAGNFDIYIPFIERALMGRQGEEAHGWLRPGGRLAYILPNRFMNAGYAGLLRQNLPRVAHLRSLLNMGAATFQPPSETRASKLFKEAMVYPAILSVQKRPGTPATPESPAPFPAVRLVPRALPIDPADALRQIRDAYADLRAGQPADLGDLGDALTVDPPRAGELEAGRRDFTSAGWFLMPPEERAVFEKLDEVGRQIDPDVQAALANARSAAFNGESRAGQGRAGQGRAGQGRAGQGRAGQGSTSSLGEGDARTPYRRLRTYTSTVSGGFQGIATALDGVMVLREVGQSEGSSLLTLQPRGGGGPVTIERDALRPFLFGKDVERWHVDWQGWWVVFPYLETATGFKLLPTAQYREHVTAGRGKREGRRVFAGYPEVKDFPNLETVYPHLWAYLKAHETALRGRENGRYQVKRDDEWRWYDLARPQNIEVAALPNKLLLQTASIEPRLVTDTRGYLFAGSGTHNVYGVAISGAFDAVALSAIVGSKASDFMVKNISSVFAGGYYSYGDQFIRDLPIPSSTPAQRDDLSRLARELTACTGELRELEAWARVFPGSLNDQRRTAGTLPELDSLGELAQAANLPQRLEAGKVEQAGAGLFGGTGRVTLNAGRGTLTLGAEHARLVREVLAERRSLGRDELLALRVPQREDDVRDYLGTLAGWRTRMEALRGEIETREARLNEVVYGLYGLTPDERAVIERFLERF